MEVQIVLQLLSKFLYYTLICVIYLHTPFRQPFPRRQMEGVGEEMEGVGEEMEGVGEEMEGVGKEMEGVGEGFKMEGVQVVARQTDCLCYTSCHPVWRQSP